MEPLSFIVGAMCGGLGLHLVTKELLPGHRSQPVATDARGLEVRMKHIELEWEEVFDQLRRKQGRISKVEALDRPRTPIVEQMVPAMTRGDLLRRHREQTGTA
jgi:hypothetical protein